MERVAVETLPGAEIVLRGLRDLEENIDSVEAAAVAMARTRLMAAGFDVGVPREEGPPSHRLYDRLAAADPDGAHSRFNAIQRRVASFTAAVENARAR